MSSTSQHQQLQAHQRQNCQQILQQVAAALPATPGRAPAFAISFEQLSDWWRAAGGAGADEHAGASAAQNRGQAHLLGLAEVRTAWLEQQGVQQPQRQLSGPVADIVLACDGLMAVLAQAAGLDWQEQVDPTSGAPYYHHAATSVSQWELPAAAQAVQRVLERVAAGKPRATDSSSAAVSMNPLRAGPGDQFDSELAHIDTPLDNGLEPEGKIHRVDPKFAS
jgi:hypothetical protein